MDYKTYSELARRTRNYEEPIIADNDVRRLLEAAMGMAGETAELALVIEQTKYQSKYIATQTTSIKDEVGDIDWYRQGLEEFLVTATSKENIDYNQWKNTQPPAHIDFNKFKSQMTVEEDVNAMQLRAGLILDQVKKHIMYHKPLNLTLFLQLVGQWDFYRGKLQSALDSYGLNLEAIRNYNIAKLAQRYGISPTMEN